MTSTRALMAMFLAPLVVLVAVGGALAIDEGKLMPLALTTAIGLASSAFILVTVWLVGMRTTREHAHKFAAMSAALGGEVLANMLGERQLRLPHPRGRFEIDYRVYSSDGDSHEPYTRLALMLPAGALPRTRRDLLRSPDALKKLGPATRAEVEALRGRVRLLGRGKAPSVEVWLFGWLGPEEVARALERARPHLETLATRAWTE